MMEILDCEQNSPEWLNARAGIPTASEFHTVLASGKGGGESKTRKTYLYKLAGEIITGKITEGYTNANMERGHEMEGDARNLYCFLNDVDADQVGFIRNGQKGCSPDSLIGPKGMLEVKSKFPHILIETILKDQFPPEHKAQCQGALWVAEREWIDIVCYWPSMPLFVKRAYRDEAYITTLSAAIKEFNEELADVVKQVRAYEKPGPVPEDMDALRQHPLMAG
jgi:hypothetical protein